MKKLKPGQKDPVKAALAMPDSKDKHRKICDLMLEAEYMTPLWYTLKQEADRLEDALTANADGVPCIIDHTQRGGPFIPLRVLSEGWDI